MILTGTIAGWSCGMNFGIGTSGLEVARRALEVVGTNIANSATEGYHRQDVIIEPLEFQTSTESVIGGANVREVARAIDDLLERELLRQQPLLGQLSQELNTLRELENSLGELGDHDLGATMSHMFSMMQKLSMEPSSTVLQESVVWAADAVARQFNNIAGIIEELESVVSLESSLVSQEINSLSAEISELNGQIAPLLMRGGNANLILDKRDQAVSRLAELVDVSVYRQADKPGVVSIDMWGTPIVTSNSSTEITLGLNMDQKLGYSVEGANYWTTDISGGKVGAMASLKNVLLPEIKGRLDAIATSMIREINGYHVQGIGNVDQPGGGSFTELIGTPFGSPTAVIGDIDSNIVAGTVNLRMTDLTTDTVSYYEVAIDPADTVADVANAFSTLPIPNLLVTVSDTRLQMQVTDSSRYRFDFVPYSDVITPMATGTASPTISGQYTGTANETYTATVSGTGGPIFDVSIDDVFLTITDGSGSHVKTINVGSGYAAGDRIEITNGLHVQLGSGTLVNGEFFDIAAMADSDSSGILAAAGINTFFSGTSAKTMEVRQDIMSSPWRLATTLGGADNMNIARMADIENDKLGDLRNTTVTEAYRSMTASLGERIVSRDMRQSSIQNITDQLLKQRDDVGGVDMNDEAAKLIIFEQMFQALAKFIKTQENAMNHLMDIMQ